MDGNPMSYYMTPDGIVFKEWTATSIQRRVGASASVPTEPPQTLPLSLGGKTIYSFTPTAPSMSDHQRVASQSIEITNDVAHYVYTYEDKDLATYKTERKDAVSQKKWEVETGGITIDGAVIDTTRESQGLINGAYSLALRKADQPGFSINFRGSNGWVTLDAATMIAIGEAVALHIQASFDRFRELEEAIDACTTVEQVAAIDITTGWPA